MNPCYDCGKNDIDYLLEHCGWRDPETMETKKLELDGGRTVYACPNLESDGVCKIEATKPEICRDYVSCPKFSQMDLVDLIG